MPSFDKGGGTQGPFGRNEILRSTNPVPQTESYTLAASTITAQTLDGYANQKIVQPGLVMAKITSGVDIGKVGPAQPGVTDGRQTAANLVGINFTFLPWQTIERDVEISVITDATLVQAWCTEYDAAGASIQLSNTIADALRSGKRLDIKFS